MTPECDLCGDTGWITCVDYDDSGYEIPCPEGCPMPGDPQFAEPGQEVPF